MHTANRQILTWAMVFIIAIAPLRVAGAMPGDVESYCHSMDMLAAPMLGHGESHIPATHNAMNVTAEQSCCCHVDDSVGCERACDETCVFGSVTATLESSTAPDFAAADLDKSLSVDRILTRNPPPLLRPPVHFPS